MSITKTEAPAVPSPLEVANKVARHMGPQWTPALDRRHKNAARIFGPDDQVLRLEIGGHKIARGSVRVLGEINWRGTALPSIQISLRKSPERMAEEVIRRLLPLYRERLAEAKARRTEASRVERVKRATETRLAQILRSQSVGPFVGLFRGLNRFVVEDDQNVKFEIRISHAGAIRVAQLLAAIL